MKSIHAWMRQGVILLSVLTLISVLVACAGSRQPLEWLLPPPIAPEDITSHVEAVPADGPWVWTSTRDCNDLGGQLIIIDATGSIMRLSSILDTIDRAGASPLLVTCTDDGRLAIIDPLSGVQTRLAPEADPRAYGFVLSPDGTRVAFAAPHRVPGPSVPHVGGTEKMAEFVQVAELSTGTVWKLVDIPPPPRRTHPYKVELIGWGTQGLYIHMAGDGTNLIWRIDPAQEHPPLAQVAELPTGLWQLHVITEVLVRVKSPTGPLTLLDLQTGEEKVIDAGKPYPDQVYPRPFLPLSPDGTKLAFFQFNENETAFPGWELRTYDVLSGTAEGVAGPFYSWLSIAWLMGGNDILADAQEMIIDQGRLREIKPNVLHVYTLDGTLLGTAPALAWIKPAWIMRDDQLLYLFAAGDHFVLRSVPLRGGDHPDHEDLKIPGARSARIVYATPAERTLTKPNRCQSLVRRIKNSISPIFTIP